MERSTMLTNVKKAHQRISSMIYKTPLYKVEWLSEETGANVYFKLESEQRGGSFKIRGAANKIFSMIENGDIKENDVIVTYSTGNHGIACAIVAAEHGLRMRVYAGKNVKKTKALRLQGFKNVDFIIEGRNCDEAQVNAQKYAQENRLPYIDNFNDAHLISGVGTLALEVYEKLPNIDAVIVPPGGGTLLGMSNLILNALSDREVTAIGCQPTSSSHLYRSLHDLPGDDCTGATFGLEGPGFAEGRTPYQLCKEVKEWQLVSEEEIERAAYDVMHHENKIIEGVSAEGVAGVRKLGTKFKGKNVVVVITGRNLGVADIRYLIEKYGGEN